MTYYFESPSKRDFDEYQTNFYLQAGKSLSAIVVDYDKDVLESFCDYLKLKNVNILGSGNTGADAVNLYKKFKPDVVFLDYTRYEMDCIHAIKQIKELESKSQIIVMTNHYCSDVRLKLEKYGITSILSKSFHRSKMNDLLDYLKKLDLT